MLVLCPFPYRIRKSGATPTQAGIHLGYREIVPYLKMEYPVITTYEEYRKLNETFEIHLFTTIYRYQTATK